MSEIRKLPASAGAEWVLGGFALLRKAPLGLGLLGVLWGLASLLAVTAIVSMPALGIALQLLLALAGPVLFAGLVWAVREVDRDRPAVPGHLLQGLREGKLPALLATLLPQLAAGLLLGIALLVLIGPAQLQSLFEVTERINEMARSGAQPSPDQVEEMMGALPAGRILLWLLLVVVVFVAAIMTVFVSVPRILFDGRGGIAALGDSLRACLRNAGAMAVFLLVLFVALFAIYFAVTLVTLVVQAVGGAALGSWIAQLLLTGVVMPLLAGVAYQAWKQMFGGTPGAQAPAGPQRDVIEA